VSNGPNFYLYVILDIFSRYVVGWMVANRESAELAKRLLAETSQKQQIAPDQLTLHADRGTSMRSKPVASRLADLGVTKTHSRPHDSDGNRFSESRFTTLKCRPEFHDRFGSIQDARAFCQLSFPGFFPWYNTEHHHSRIGLLTPEVLHYGRADEVIGQRLDCFEPAVRTESRTLRPGESQIAGQTPRRLDQPAARAGGERAGATLI
jgi:putative transposase